jgi:hypothetical protein
LARFDQARGFLYLYPLPSTWPGKIPDQDKNVQEAGNNFDFYRGLIERQRGEIRKRIIGQPRLIEALFLCFYAHWVLLARRHLIA